MKISVLVFAFVALYTYTTQAVSTYVNPKGEWSSSEAQSLQGILDSKGNVAPNRVVISSDADQLDDGVDAYWRALTAPSAYIVIEVAGFAPNNNFGIYDKVTGAKQQLFAGSASAGAGVIGFTPTWSEFGFYIDNTVNNFSWYSDTSKNAGGGDQMVAYAGKGATLNVGGAAGSQIWDANSYILGFEDLALASSDKDYQDMVVLVKNVAPVPDGAMTIVLLGAAFLGLCCVRRV
jgi:hypothetical protein